MIYSFIIIRNFSKPTISKFAPEIFMKLAGWPRVWFASPNMSGKPSSIIQKLAPKR